VDNVLVWVLIVSSWNSTKNMAEQLGPYASKDDCMRVYSSTPLANFERQCVQVRIPLLK
jgi:hypothetical protein